MAGSLLTREVFWALAVHVQFVPCPRKVHTQAEDRTRKAGNTAQWLRAQIWDQTPWI